MDLEDTEARNNCAGEGQQLFNLPTERPSRPLAEAWWAEETPLLEALRSNAKSSCETVPSQRGQNPLNKEAEKSTAVGAVPKPRIVKT
jgi:hypothetical protein